MKNKNRIKAWAKRITSEKGEHIRASSDPKFRHEMPCEIVFNNGWIHVSERKPTKRDGNKLGFVMRPDTCGYPASSLWEDVTDGFWQSFPKAPKKKGARK